MRKIIVLIMVLLPCTSFAVSNCQIIEYPDHFEAMCTGKPAQTEAASRLIEQAKRSVLYQAAGKDQAAEQEQALASDQAPDSETPDVPPELIVRNDLARLHGAAVLKTRAGQ
jgi:hypothetical protein